MIYEPGSNAKYLFYSRWFSYNLIMIYHEFDYKQVPFIRNRQNNYEILFIQNLTMAYYILTKSLNANRIRFAKRTL